MNLLCWFTGHSWARKLAIRCERCGAMPYDDITAHEWWFNFYRFTLAPKIHRARLWIKSRRCWTPGHDWQPYAAVCQRCGMTGTEDAESGEWMLPEWKKLWRVWLSDRFYVVKPYLQEQNIYAVEALGARFGIERSTIYIRGEKYITRYMLYLGPIGLRLHQFFRGDDDRASHTHPWSFITFPFTSYVERTFKEGVEQGPRKVKAWQFHYRPSDFEHIVIGTETDYAFSEYRYLKEYTRAADIFWTFVITGPKTDEWGFYPAPGKYVSWQEYKS